MNESTFKRLIQAAESMDGDYSTGYRRGLRKHYHGEDFGTPQEHAKWMGLGLHGDHQMELGAGYRAGFAAEEFNPKNPGKR